ncbi:MAG: HAD hydrolase family protein [Clostridia bacterium]|nr:HAD hydrolase family protein [Clostridia bacterium]
MKEDIRFIASDIEGTLINLNGELRSGVNELLHEVVKRDIPIFLESGMSYFEILKVAEKIKEETGLGDKLKFDIASNSGSYIKLRDGKVIKDNHIEKNYINEIKKIVQEKASGTVIIYRGIDENYRQRAYTTEGIKGKVLNGFYVTAIDALKKFNKLSLSNITVSKNILDAKIEFGEIKSLELATLEKNKLKEIKKEIENKFGKDFFSINIGRTLQISLGNKLEAMKDIVEQKSGSRDVENVCVLGDAMNDIVSMKEAGACVICHSKYKEVYKIAEDSIKEGKTGKYAVGEFDDETIKMITGQDYNSNKMIESTKTAKQFLEGNSNNMGYSE